MPFLTEIQTRINSTQDTKKITQSLELVAASKMKSFVSKAFSTRVFASGLLESLKLMVASPEGQIFAEKRTEGKHVFILVTSDKGLCGSLNQRLIKHLFESKEWKKTPKDQRALVTVGKKGTEAARKYNETPVQAFPGIGEDITPLSSLHLIDGIIKMWKSGEAKQVSIISPHYTNPFTSHVTTKTFLPFSLEMAETHLSWHYGQTSSNRSPLPPVFEPNESRVADILTLQLVETLFMESFYELKAAEYASRMVAMKKATESATDLVRTLTLEYNKARQANITQQVAELATASEAMEI